MVSARLKGLASIVCPSNGHKMGEAFQGLESMGYLLAGAPWVLYSIHQEAPMALFGRKLPDVHKLMRDKQYKKAIKVLEYELKRNPNDFKDRLRLAEAYEGAGRIEDSIQVYVEEGESCVSGGSTRQGIVLLKKALKLDPENKEISDRIEALESVSAGGQRTGVFSFDLDDESGAEEAEAEAEAEAGGEEAEFSMADNASGAEEAPAEDKVEEEPPQEEEPPSDAETEVEVEEEGESPSEEEPAEAASEAVQEETEVEVEIEEGVDETDEDDSSEAELIEQEQNELIDSATGPLVDAYTEEEEARDEVTDINLDIEAESEPDEAEASDPVEVAEESAGDAPEVEPDSLPAEEQGPEPAEGESSEPAEGESSEPLEEEVDLLPDDTGGGELVDDSAELELEPEIHQVETGSPPSKLSSADDPVDLLRELFPGLTTHEAGHIVPMLKDVHLKPGDILLKEGEEGDSLFLVVDGCLEASARFEKVNLHLGELQRCDVIGEVAFLKGVPRTATIMAVEPSRLMELSKRAVHERLQKDPELMERLESILEERANRTIDLLKQSWRQD